MNRNAVWLALLALALAQGAAAQTTNNTTSGASSGSSSNSISTSNQNQYVSPQATSSSNQTTNAVSGSSSYGNVGNSTTNTMNPTANANANSSTASRSDSSNAGNNQVIQFITPAQTADQAAAARSAAQDLQATPTTQNDRVEYSGTQTIRNVPSVNGPPLTTSNDTCMGSSSGSINGPGFGIGLGSTWTDRNCVMLKNARELWNMGMKAAAMALFCTDTANRNALELTGFVCPQTARAQQQAALQAESARQAQLAREVERPVAAQGPYPPGLPPGLAAAAPAERATVATPSPPAQAAADVSTALKEPAQVTVSPVREASVQPSWAASSVRR